MCSFGFTNKKIDNIYFANEFSKLRGPDHTNIIEESGYTIVYNLLSITGKFTVQPFIDRGADIICFYNGEIYNYEDFGAFKTDGECLIHLYKEFGTEFIKKLDGEFAIVLADFLRQILIVSSDVFATKPIWISLQDKKIGVATYESFLRRSDFNNVEKIPANTGYVYSLKNFELIDTLSIFEFNLNQHKRYYDDFITAFENSIRKRTRNLREKIFIGLSSGYDTGAIANELVKQKVNFKAYTIMATENEKVLEQRHSILKNSEMIRLKSIEYEQSRLHLKNNCESFLYDGYNIKEDKGAVGLSYICKKARAEGYKIYLSGQGADEIISDYGWQGQKIYRHSEFGGLFPKDLKSIFPYRSFYGGTQIKYLNKEEYVAGSYGIETRYPFLDRDLVQEFLWLDVDLKNKNYKAPLREYLLRNGVPFDEGKKLGFQANRNLIYT